MVGGVIEALLALGRDGLVLALVLAAPFLIGVVAAGAVSAVVGWMTQVRDPALGLAPRVAGVAIALGFAAPMIGRQMVGFAARAWELIAQVRM